MELFVLLNLYLNLSQYYGLVPAALEGVFDDLKIEVNEGEKDHEFDIVLVGNGVMHKEKRPGMKNIYILVHLNLTTGDEKR